MTLHELLVKELKALAKALSVGDTYECHKGHAHCASRPFGPCADLLEREAKGLLELCEGCGGALSPDYTGGFCEACTGGGLLLC